ncbi:hypothetical protein FJ366_03010, partial [Candidatus Dependentiae bacterium]|nr:hypothetical protein [Candidatus Dependentiae bacterium]
MRGAEMIPVVLRLKNFLSYGPNEQVINFEPYSLICLSGKNGHGKSSILDAITWAIWGCARKTTGVAKGDEGLVHLGQKEMVVHLEFISGASRYRIRREVFKSYGKTINRLDVEVYDKNTQQFVTLTDKSIRATQDKIEKLVGVDFVTFVSTSFLRQGQSNEFSKKTPRERKDIIASIIGLKKFDQLAVLANEQSKQLAQEIVQVQFKGEQARILSAQKPEIEELVSLAEKKIIQVEAVLLEGVARYDLFVQKSKKILELIEQKNNLEADIVASEHLEKENKRHVGLAVKKWREMHALRINLPSFDSLMQQRAAMVEAIQELQNKKELSYRYNDELVSLKNKKNNLEVSWTHEFELKKSELLRKKNERVVEIKFYEAAQKELFDKKKEKEELLILCRQHISHQIALLANKNEHELLYDREKALFEKRKAFYHSCVSKKNFALATLAEAQDRSSLIENVSSPACPLCEQLLTQRRKQYLAQQLSRSNYLLTHRLNRISLILKQLEEVLKAQRTILESTGKHCAQLVQCEQDLIRFNQQEVVLTGELASIVEREAQLSQIITLNIEAIAEHEKELIFLEHELTNKKKNDASFIQITSQILATEQAASGLLFEPEKMEQALGLLKKIETALSEIQAKAHQ